MTEESLLSNLKDIIGIKILAVYYIQTESHTVDQLKIDMEVIYNCTN